jgi:hypothetical protein
LCPNSWYAVVCSIEFYKIGFESAETHLKCIKKVKCNHCQFSATVKRVGVTRSETSCDCVQHHKMALSKHF